MKYVDNQNRTNTPQNLKVSAVKLLFYALKTKMWNKIFKLLTYVREKKLKDKLLTMLMKLVTIVTGVEHSKSLFTDLKKSKIIYI